MKKFVVFWERMANSGIAEIEATCKAEAIKKMGLNPKFVKMTCYEVDSWDKLEVGQMN